MQQYIVLIPEIILLAAAIVVLFAEYFGGDRSAAIVGTIAAAVGAALVWVIPTPVEAFHGYLRFGEGVSAATMRSSIAVLTALLLLWVVARGWEGVNAREATSLVLFSAVGGMLLVSANEMVTMFVSLELSTLPAYVLVGYDRLDRKSLEGAIKFFLLSMLTSLILAYGLSFIYGLAGKTVYHALPASSGSLAMLAGLFVIFGFLAKTTAVPFHFWSPDAYAGASSTSVAFVAAIAKMGPVWALARFVGVVLPQVEGMSLVLIIVSVVSMVLGHFVAIIQQDTRRIIAYSGIGNIGYMLLGISAGTVAGFSGAVFFVVIYAVAVVGQMLVIAQEGPTLTDLAGLVRRRPYAAWCSVGFLFSLIGFPPMVGFFGKLAVFSAAYNVGYGWAVFIAILVSVVSAGYAFNILRAMFTPGEGAPADYDRPMFEETTSYRQFPALAGLVIFVLTFLSIGLGIIAQPLVQLLGVGLF
jgi:NADH-quinone oxidoreductase subunit N